MNLDWPKFSAYQMRTMQNEPAAGPKPVGGDPRIMQWAKPSYGQGVGGAVYQAPENLPRAMPPMTGGGSTPPAPNNWINGFMANGGVVPPEAPKPAVNMSAMRGSPASTVGYSMGQAASAPRSIGAPYAVPMQGTPAEAAGVAGVAGGLGSFKNFLAAPSIGTAVASAVPLYVAGKAAGQLTGGVYDALHGNKNPILDARREARNEAINAFQHGDYGRAVGSGVRAMGQTAGAMAGDMLSPFKNFVGGVAGGVTGAPANPITMDADGNFSRAPTNMAEYKHMMGLKAAKPEAIMGNLSTMGPASADQIKGAYDRLGEKPVQEDPFKGMSPEQIYAKQRENRMARILKTPTSKLTAQEYTDYSDFVKAQRAPELMQQNIMRAASYDLAHPEMVTSETHHRDGSWSKTYGDRSKDAMTGYSTFRDVLSKEPYYNSQAQAALTKADNSEKFTKADAVGMVGQTQQRMMQELYNPDVPVAQRIRNARAYWPSFKAALKQNGLEPPEFDEFIQEQTGAMADPQYPGTYKLPK